MFEDNQTALIIQHIMLLLDIYQRNIKSLKLSFIYWFHGKMGVLITLEMSTI